MKKQALNDREREIQKIKKALLKVTEMRSGSLTRQFRNPEEKKGAYYSLSYTHKTKSRTEYIHPEDVAQIKRQIAQYKKFKTLVARWIDLALEQCRSQLQRKNKAPSAL